MLLKLIESNSAAYFWYKDQELPSPREYFPSTTKREAATVLFWKMHIPFLCCWIIHQNIQGLIFNFVTEFQTSACLVTILSR